MVHLRRLHHSVTHALRRVRLHSDATPDICIVMPYEVYSVAQHCDASEQTTEWHKEWPRQSV
jgi:hypothetical protein